MISPYSFRERILLYGGSGVGKSKCYLDLYDIMEDSHFYVIDTDTAADFMFEGRDRSRLTFEEPNSYRDCASAFLRFSQRANRDDWLVIDLGDPLWIWTQTFWKMSYFGKTEEEMLFFIEPKTQKIRGKEVPFRPNWSEINRMYDTLIRTAFEAKCHIIMICGETTISDGGGDWDDAADILSIYRSEGTKPQGNKRNSHYFHTILHLIMNGPKYRASIPKEREGREKLWVEKAEITDLTFWDYYLSQHWAAPEKEITTPKKRIRKKSA